MWDRLFRVREERFDSPPLVSIEELIPEIGKIKPPLKNPRIHFGKTNTPYMSHYRPRDSRLEGVEGGILVDLGAGDDTAGYELALRSRAAGYVGVERFNAHYLSLSLRRFLTDPNSRSYLSGERISRGCPIIPAAVVCADMRDFLRALPEESVSVLTSGMDHSILPDENYRNESRDYIQRVVGNRWTHLSHCSPGLSVL